MSRQQAVALLDSAFCLGIRSFDTAEAYGLAAERLSEWLEKKPEGEVAIVTKISPSALHTADTTAVRAAAGRFTRSSGVTVLAHGAVDQNQWSVLRWAAHACGVEPGVSVYAADEVKASVYHHGVSRVQAPANVLDLNVFSAREASGVPLDLRSVFLQGLLLEEPSSGESRVTGGGSAIQAVRHAARKVGYPLVPLLISSVLSRADSHDRVVVGADEPGQIEEVLTAFDVPDDVVFAFCDFVSSSFHPTSRLLDPRQW